MLNADLWLRFLLLALAVYRAAELITQDDGPKDIFLRLRIALGAYDRDGQGRVKRELGRLVECPYCTGVWLAKPAALVLIFVPMPTQLPPGDLWGWLALLIWGSIVWLAIAGLQAAIETIAGRAAAGTDIMQLDEETRATLKQIAQRLGD